jgi:hypothetical protein
MSTMMTEPDWANALEVFRASLPRRGAKGRDDRLFLQALHYFSVHNVTGIGRSQIYFFFCDGGADVARDIQVEIVAHDLIH